MPRGVDRVPAGTRLTEGGHRDIGTCLSTVLFSARISLVASMREPSEPVFGDAPGEVPARDQRSDVLAELSHLHVLSAGNERGSNESASNPRLSRW